MTPRSLRAEDDHGLRPEADSPALQDEDEALREFGFELEDPEYWDDVSGAVLPAKAVKAARSEEVTFMEGWHCWEKVTYEEAVRCEGPEAYRDPMGGREQRG